MLHLNSLFQLLETWVLLIRHKDGPEISQREKIHGRPWICGKFHITVVSWIFFWPLKGRKKTVQREKLGRAGNGWVFWIVLHHCKIKQKKIEKNTKNTWEMEVGMNNSYPAHRQGYRGYPTISRMKGCNLSPLCLPWTDRPLGFKLWECAAEGFMWKSSSETTMALKRNVTKLVGGLREFSPHFFLATWKKRRTKKGWLQSL